VAVDPRLNWAMVTPGGAGIIGIIDLGRAPSTGLTPDVGRRPELIASLGISSTVQGIGINTETHEALLADPVAQTLTTFSLMNDAVSPVTFTFQGTSLATPNLASAAVSPLENLGIAVQNDGTLTVDSGTLTSALQNNYGDVQNFFQGTALNGFANSLDQQLTSFTGPEGAFRLPDVERVAVVVERANGVKCARSWRYFDPATASPDFPDVTPRDAEALRELKDLGRLP